MSKRSVPDPSVEFDLTIGSSTNNRLCGDPIAVLDSSSTAIFNGLLSSSFPEIGAYSVESWPRRAPSMEPPLAHSLLAATRSKRTEKNEELT